MYFFQRAGYFQIGLATRLWSTKPSSWLFSGQFRLWYYFRVDLTTTTAGSLIVCMYNVRTFNLLSLVLVESMQSSQVCHNWFKENISSWYEEKKHRKQYKTYCSLYLFFTTRAMLKLHLPMILISLRQQTLRKYIVKASEKRRKKRVNLKNKSTSFFKRNNVGENTSQHINNVAKSRLWMKLP